MKYGQRLIFQISLLLFSSCLIHAQQTFDVEKAIESLFSLPEENINYEEFYERYFLLYDKPLDLNTAQYLDLKSLFVFSELEIQQILQYRDSIGTIQTIYELAYLDNLNLDVLAAINPFVSTKYIASAQDLINNIKSQSNAYLITRFERRLEISRGFQSQNFVGDRNRVYVRYNNRLANRMSYGLTIEKDPGEAFIFDGSTYRYGMDYWSGHLMIENQKKLKRIIIGDYQMQLGQGLVFSSGLSIGKGSEVINSLEKISLGIRPYTSVIEGGFLRGIAATYQINRNWQVTPFFSSLRQDASLRTIDLESSDLSFSSFQNSGLHRTANELANKKDVREILGGFNIGFTNASGRQYGFTLNYNHFGSPINRGTQIVNRFEFAGQYNVNASLYANTNLRQFRTFGELAISKSGGLGIVGGISGDLAPQLEVAILARFYEKDFHSLRSGAFGEGSRNINEEGIYLGLKYKFNKQLNVQMYYDQYRFRWLRFRTNQPSRGYDLMSRINYFLGKRAYLYFQFRKENKERNLIVNNDLIVAKGTSKRYILHLTYDAQPNFSLRSKIQWSSYQIGDQFSNGIAFFQDLMFNLNKHRFDLRFSMFDTNGTDNRQYAYEQDLIYNFSIPGLSGKGIRNYILWKYQLNRRLAFGVKFSRTTFFDRNQIGTGVDQINGNIITDLKVQSIYRFK